MSGTASEGSLARYAASRLATAVLVLIGAMALLCSLTLIVPGDPATILLGPRATPEAVAIFREQMGLDLPLHERVFVFFLHAVQGDLGVDVLSSRPVADMVIGRAAQHAAAGGLGDRACGADRHPDRLLCGDPTGQPARPGAGDPQRRLRRDAELCRGDPAALLLFGPARLVPGARRRRCRQSPRPAAPSGAADHRARLRLDRLHRAAGALLAARSAGRALSSAPRAPTASRSAGWS